MKKLIDIDKTTWAKVRQLATLEECNLNVMVMRLLEEAIANREKKEASQTEVERN